MAEFKESYIVLQVPKTGDIRTTITPLTYYSDIVQEWIHVPIGLLTDLGSIPQLLQSIFPKDGLAVFAYILHDFLYKVGKYARSVCDRILEEAMKLLGVNWITRKAVREGLRISGWVAWNAHRRNDESNGITGNGYAI